MSDDAERLSHLLARIDKACRRKQILDPKSRQSLTPHQASVLESLEIESTATLKELARSMGVGSATMCVAVDRLERLGYVIKERFAGDARLVHIRLTGRGDFIRRSASLLDPERVAELLAPLSAEERDQALKTFELLAEALGRFADRPAA